MTILTAVAFAEQAWNWGRASSGPAASIAGN